MTRIKICGLTNEQDVHLCASAGADALGFVVEYPVEVPWNLNRETARRLMARMPPFVTSVAVVGDDPDQVLGIAETVKPNVVQLHGREPFAVTAEMIRGLKSLGIGVIKALRFSTDSGELDYDLADPIEACHALAEAGADAIVADSFTRSRPAGTGKRFDWKVARFLGAKTPIPLILAGGLTAENVGRAIVEVNPYGVDVISGVEGRDHKKEPDKVRAFVQAVKSTRCRAGD